MAALKLDEEDSFPGESGLVVDGILRLPELESAFPGIYSDDPLPDYQLVLGFCRIPELGDLLKFGLRQLASESSRDRLRHNFACFMVDHSDLTAEPFLAKAIEFFAEFNSPWGPLESLAFASNLGAGGGISGGLHGRALEEDCKKVLELLRASFTGDGSSKRSAVAADESQPTGYYILGAYGSSERCGITSVTSRHFGVTKELNTWLRTWLPGHTWTSLCINSNEKIALHADLGNLPGTLNHSIALGDFVNGALWVEDSSGTELRSFDNVDGQLHGRCVDTRRQFFSFDARSRRYVQDWTGVRWSVTAYTCRRLQDFSKADLKTLVDLGFPLPDFPAKRLLESYKGDQHLRVLQRMGRLRWRHLCWPWKC